MSVRHGEGIAAIGLLCELDLALVAIDPSFLHGIGELALPAVENAGDGQVVDLGLPAVLPVQLDLPDILGRLGALDRALERNGHLLRSDTVLVVLVVPGLRHDDLGLLALVAVGQLDREGLDAGRGIDGLGGLGGALIAPDRVLDKLVLISVAIGIGRREAICLGMPTVVLDEGEHGAGVLRLAAGHAALDADRHRVGAHAICVAVVGPALLRGDGYRGLALVHEGEGVVR